MRSVVIVIILVALFSSAPVPSPTTSVAASPDVQTALARLDTFIQEAMAKTKVPGLAVAVVFQDRVVFLKGYGVRKIGDLAPGDADTVFEVASVSKPISFTIIASFGSTGDIRLGDPILGPDPR